MWRLWGVFGAGAPHRDRHVIGQYLPDENYRALKPVTAIIKTDQHRMTGRLSQRHQSESG